MGMLYEYGEFAEVAFKEYLTQKGFNAILHKSLSSYSFALDKTLGDVFILQSERVKRTITIDVKRGNLTGEVFVSRDSAYGFTGNWFALVHCNLNMDKSYLVHSYTIKKFMQTAEENGSLKVGPSGDLGFYFNPKLLKKAYKLSENLHLFN